MNQKSILLIFSLFFLVFSVTGTSIAANSKAGQQNKSGLLNRIDFGNSYIMGQSIKSGAVYLLQRKKSEIKSMLEYRTDYRKEILEEFSIKDLEHLKMDRKNKNTKKYRK